MIDGSAGLTQFLQQATLRESYVRVELLDRSELPVTSIEPLVLRSAPYDPTRPGPQVVDGSVSAVATPESREIRRSLNLTIADPGLDWLPGPGRLVWLDKRLLISKGFRLYPPYGSGQVEWVPLGVFVLSDQPDAQDAGGGLTVRLQGQDKSYLTLGQPVGAFPGEVLLSQGIRVRAAIEALAGLSTWSENRLSLEDPDYTLPFDRRFSPDNSSPWGAAVSVAGIAGDYIIGYDAAGYLRFRRDPDPLQLAPVWTFGPDPAGLSLYIAGSKTLDVSEARNWVIVLGGSAQTDPVRSEAKNQASGYASIDQIGPRIYRHAGGRPDPLVNSQAQADVTAQYWLRHYQRYAERVPLELVEVPMLEPLDVIGLDVPTLGLQGNYQLLRVTVSLTSGQMAAEAWRVRSFV